LTGTPSFWYVNSRQITQEKTPSCIPTPWTPRRFGATLVIRIGRLTGGGRRPGSWPARRVEWGAGTTRPFERGIFNPNDLIAITELPEGRDAVRQCTPEEAWGRVFAALRR
jgi:hypothetical protein